MRRFRFGLFISPPLVDAVPAGTGWIHEMKYDGYRTLLAIGGGAGRCYRRSGLDWSDRFPGIVAEARKLRVKSALIDGETVVLDAKGRSNFQALQNALKAAPATIDYFAFDLLELNGGDLTRLPLLERKARLKAVLLTQDQHIRYSDHIEGSGEKLLERFCAAGLEGVVSKLGNSKYVGARSGSWVRPSASSARSSWSPGGCRRTNGGRSAPSSWPSRTAASCATPERSGPASTRPSWVG